MGSNRGSGAPHQELVTHFNGGVNGIVQKLAPPPKSNLPPDVRIQSSHKCRSQSLLVPSRLDGQTVEPAHELPNGLTSLAESQELQTGLLTPNGMIVHSLKLTCECIG